MHCSFDEKEMKREEKKKTVNEAKKTKKTKKTTDLSIMCVLRSRESYVYMCVMCLELHNRLRSCSVFPLEKFDEKNNFYLHMNSAQSEENVLKWPINKNRRNEERKKRWMGECFGFSSRGCCFSPFAGKTPTQHYAHIPWSLRLETFVSEYFSSA